MKPFVVAGLLCFASQSIRAQCGQDATCRAIQTILAARAGDFTSIRGAFEKQDLGFPYWTGTVTLFDGCQIQGPRHEGDGSTYLCGLRADLHNASDFSAQLRQFLDAAKLAAPDYTWWKSSGSEEGDAIHVYAGPDTDHSVIEMFPTDVGYLLEIRSP